MPKKLFPSQQPNEKVYLVFREHWFRLAVKFSIVGLLMLLPIIIRLLFIDARELFNDSQSQAIISLVLQVYYMGLLLALFLIWVLYYLNLGIDRKSVV